MKKQFNPTFLLGFATLLILASCQKTDSNLNPGPGGLRSAPSHDSSYNPPVVLFDPASIGPPPSTSPPPSQPAPQNSCPSLPIYGDTIIYPQPTSGSDYIVHPVNNPGPGKYLSWPVGMVLDSVTGAIDVTASETGMKYYMGFVAKGTTDTCISYLTIGGAAYAPSVNVLTSGQTTSVPYFEANPTDLNLCQTSNACAFDVTGSAAKMKVVVNKSTGVIDLQKTLNGGLLTLGGAFGLLPVNGQTIVTDIYYKINNDPSHSALQHISVQLVYYDSPSMVNSGLLGLIINQVDRLTSGNPISTTSNPRPPLVVIVRHN
ncbi:MAG TPA: hypothetical protein VFE32_16990 [Puia sp.]|jgi:hypothetical protein|nr:hypothetical protein [Puia sp.]